MNLDYVLRLRSRLEVWIGQAAARHPPREPVDPTALADHLNAIIEGSIIWSKALKDPALMGRQTRLFRQHVKLLFGV